MYNSYVTIKLLHTLLARKALNISPFLGEESKKLMGMLIIMWGKQEVT